MMVFVITADNVQVQAKIKEEEMQVNIHSCKLGYELKASGLGNLFTQNTKHEYKMEIPRCEWLSVSRTLRSRSRRLSGGSASWTARCLQMYLKVPEVP